MNRWWLLSILLASPLACGAPSRASATYASYEQVATSNLPGDVLWKVIAREGKSKNYDDLLPLDGGTVGIAHFAVGGLASLYREMDTEKHFGRTPEEMIKHYSSACRPRGKSGNDTGWGCYSQPWWRDGMTSFLQSPESRPVQVRAWGALMRPAIDAALAGGWRSERQIAIALGIANSLGSGGFEKLAIRHAWNAEATLAAYVGSDAHRQRRKEALDEAFPVQREDSLSPTRRYGFNWLDPGSQCHELTNKDVASFDSCEASSNAFGLDLESHACKVDDDTELMVYATQAQCQQALETMQANGP